MAAVPGWNRRRCRSSSAAAASCYTCCVCARQYRERRDYLLSCAARHFGDVEISGEAGGLHLFWQLPAGVPDAATVEALGRRARVGVYSLHSGSVFDPYAGALSRRGIDAGLCRVGPEADRARDRAAVGRGGRRAGRASIGLGDLLVHRPASRRCSARWAGRLGGRQTGPTVSPATGSLRRVAASGRIARIDRRRGQAPMPVVTGLYRYPIKGLSPQPVAAVRVEAGKPFPFDRVFALARPGYAR